MSHDQPFTAVHGYRRERDGAVSRLPLFLGTGTKATCVNEYRPIVLTSVAMKCYERLVMAHITTIIPETLDPLQFAYRPNRSIDDAISIVLPAGQKEHLRENAIH